MPRDMLDKQTRELLRRHGEQASELAKALQPSRELAAAIERMGAISSEHLAGISRAIERFQGPDLTRYTKLFDSEHVKLAAKLIQASPFQDLPKLAFPHIDIENMYSKLGGIPALLAEPHITQALLRATEQMASLQTQFAEIADRYRGFAQHFPPSETMRWLLDDQRAFSLVEALGIVPHGALWSDILELDPPDDPDSFALEFALKVWPDLKGRVELTPQECLGDPRLAEQYAQLLRAHDAQLFEAVMSSAVSIIERAVKLGRSFAGRDLKTFAWLDKEVGKLPAGYLAYRDIRLWNVMLTEVFAQCYDDSVADNSTYPNRHAIAHGVGTQVATVIDSLNAILLAHFAIKAVTAVRQYQRDLAAEDNA